VYRWLPDGTVVPHSTVLQCMTLAGVHVRSIGYAVTRYPGDTVTRDASDTVTVVHLWLDKLLPFAFTGISSTCTCLTGSDTGTHELSIQ